MTEQTMSFCQVVLNTNLVDNVKNDPYHLNWKAIVENHEHKAPNDPLPFPFDDPDPQCYFPLSEEYPWHNQIHRDAFGYGEVPATIDQRVVVDLRWFGYVKPSYGNFVQFSKDCSDGFGMPQVRPYNTALLQPNLLVTRTDRVPILKPTFHYRIDQEDSERTLRMITEYVYHPVPPALLPCTVADQMTTQQHGRSRKEAGRVSARRRAQISPARLRYSHLRYLQGR